jgi:hypothetical protein
MSVHIPIVVYISPSFYPDYKECYYILFCIHCFCMSNRTYTEDSLITVTMDVTYSRST